MRNPWRNLHFEDAKSFCAQKGLYGGESRADAARRDGGLRQGGADVSRIGPRQRQNQEVFEQINALIAAAEAAGVRAGIDFLRDLLQQAADANWLAFRTCARKSRVREPVDFLPAQSVVCRPIACGTRVAAAGRRGRRRNARGGKASTWRRAARCSIRKRSRNKWMVWRDARWSTRSAAAFQMVADGRVATMSQMMDLVASDPGLSAQILVGGQRLEHDELNEVEDAAGGCRAGWARSKLNALARTLPHGPRASSRVPPFTWTNFWMFQVAVGRVAQFICSYLDFDYLASNAYTAGLLQDIGKLFLLKLHPFGLQAIVRHARERKMAAAPMPSENISGARRATSRCTSRRPRVCRMSIPTSYAGWRRRRSPRKTWSWSPSCQSPGMCACTPISGVPRKLPIGGSVAIGATPAWSILQPHLFPSFELKKFELQAHAFCLVLKNELSGKRDRRPSHAQRAAELV